MYFESLWKSFAALPQVEAIALGGSRAGQFFDEKSDYDLYIYCTQIPDESVRRPILEANCQYMEVGNSFWELEDDCTFKDGVDIDILYRNLEYFGNDVSAVAEQHYAHNGYTTCMWHNLLHSKILYDPEGKLAALQQRFDIPYPAALRENIILRNMRLLTRNLPSYDMQIQKALGRGDLISVNHRTAAYLESYFDILFAYNRLTHPGEKRMRSYALSRAKALPAHFEEDLDALFENLFTDSAAALAALHSLTENMQALVAQG